MSGAPQLPSLPRAPRTQALLAALYEERCAALGRGATLEDLAKLKRLYRPAGGQPGPEKRAELQRAAAELKAAYAARGALAGSADTGLAGARPGGRQADAARGPARHVAKKASDRERWVAGMRKLQARLASSEA